MFIFAYFEALDVVLRGCHIFMYVYIYIYIIYNHPEVDRIWYGFKTATEKKINCT